MDDLISRQAAIDALVKAIREDPYYDSDGAGLGVCDVRVILSDLPSAQLDLSGYSDRLWRATYERGKAEAERKTGKWKLDPNGMDWNIPAWRCSECGFVASHIGVVANGLGSNPMNWAGSNFCPNCGVEMEGENR